MSVYEDKINDIENNYTQFEEILNNLTSRYTFDLDVLMQSIYDDVISVEYCDTETIERYFLELSNLIYFVSDKSEKLGIYDNISKAKAKESYNNSYLNCSTSDVKKKPTVNEIVAVAENDSKEDSMINSIYNRAYRIMNNKVESAKSMLATLSKIYGRRVQDIKLSAMQNVETKLDRQLNEGVY